MSASKEELDIYESSGSDAVIGSDSDSDIPESPVRTPKKRKLPASNGREPPSGTKKSPKPRPNNGKANESPSKLKEDIELGDQDRNTLFLDGFEGYFDQHKQREKISTTPFSRAPSLKNAEYVQLVANQPPKLRAKQAELMQKYREYYNQWALELEQDHNILLFGIGSKRRLVMDFINQWDTPLPIVVANGYNPSTNFKEILNVCASAVVDSLELEEWRRQPAERLLLLLDHLETTRKRFVLVVNSLDGPGLRESMGFMTRLISCPQIIVLATVDHINAPILWTPDELTRMRIIWHHTPTFVEMTTETAYMDVMALGQTRTAVGAHGVKFVLASLTANNQALYKVLVTAQYEKMIVKGAQATTQGAVQYAIPAGELYDRCVAELIVSNEQNFRVMMAEFYEHKMAEKSKKGSTEYIFVPYALDDLEQILADSV